jgi:ATP-dependent Lon protease
MILSKGLDSPIGGKCKMIDILSKFEKLASEWEKHAKSKNINPIKIHEVKTRISSDFHALRKLQSNSNDSSVLRNFLKENPDILFSSVDKSKKVVCISASDYNKHLENILDHNFEKLEKDPFES